MFSKKKLFYKEGYQQYRASLIAKKLESAATVTRMILDKVFKNGPSKICGIQPLKNWKGYGPLSILYPLKFFKECPPQILLGLFLNTVSF